MKTKLSKEEMYEDFKNSECKIFRHLGKAQVVCFVLMAVCLLLLIWINIVLFLKIELTLFAAAGIIAVAYNLLDKSYKSLFFEQYEKEF